MLPALRAHYAMRPLSSGLRSRIAEHIAAACANTYLLCVGQRMDVRYSLAKDPIAFAQIGRLRREVYKSARSSYLLDELDKDGLDPYDQNATSFIAETRARPCAVFAAVRAVPYPFEVLRFVSEDFLSGVLGTSGYVRTIEVSRLVSARPAKAVTNGLILFGGIYLFLHGVTRYFAYIALRERSPYRPRGYFAIPHRNPHGYSIIAGTIATHAARIGPLIWRKTRSQPRAVESGRLRTNVRQVSLYEDSAKATPAGSQAAAAAAGRHSTPTR